MALSGVRCARLLEKPCNQAMQRSRRFTSRGGNATGYASGQQTPGQEETHAFQRTINMNADRLVPNLSAPDVRHAGTGCGRWDRMAGNVNSGAASVFSYVGHMNQSEQAHSRQRAHHYGQGKHLKLNDDALNQNHVGHPQMIGVNAPPPLHRRVNAHMPSQDPAGRSDNAGALHHDPMGLMRNRGVNAYIVTEHPMTAQHDTGSRSHCAAVNHGSLREPDVGSLLYSNVYSEVQHSVASMQKGKSPGMTPPSKEYNVSKARIHASLWQQEIRKLTGDVNGNADLVSDWSMQFLHAGSEAKKSTPEGWEMSDPPQADFYEASPAKEEAMMFEEFERRRECNRVLIAGFVKQHLYWAPQTCGWMEAHHQQLWHPEQARRGPCFGAWGEPNHQLENLAQKQERRRLVRKR